MALHRLIPDEELPACLKRPLVFGDDEQISALYDLGAKIEKMEAEQEAIKNGEANTYIVKIEFTGTITKHVIAKDRFAAEEKALDMADAYECDDFDVSAFAHLPRTTKNKG